MACTPAVLACAGPSLSGIHTQPAVLQRRLGLVEHGSRTRKAIALTFDACSGREQADFDPRIARILRDTKTPATLFLGGRWAEKDPARARILAENETLEIATHSHHHRHLPTLTEEQIRGDLGSSVESLQRITGKSIRYFRPPYGDVDDRVVRIAGELGLTTVNFDLASGDADALHGTKDRLVRWLLHKARAGSIVVMHVNNPGFHTADALPEVIAGLKARGFELVTVGELLKAPEEAVTTQAPDALALDLPKASTIALHSHHRASP
jgi:peptidoglycan-N-acetylglucosamine deacetylase